MTNGIKRRLSIRKMWCAILRPGESATALLAFFILHPRRRALTGRRVSANPSDLTRAEPFGRHRRNPASLDQHHETKIAKCGTRVETGR